MIMIKKFLPAFLLFLSLNILAQDTITNPYPLLFNKNHISFSLMQGFNRPSINPVSGPYQPYPKTGYIFMGSANYSFNFSDYTGFQLGTGLGAFPVIYSVNSVDSFPGTEGDSYFMNVDYNPFSRLSAEINFRYPLGRKIFLNGIAGGSLTSFAPLGLETGSSQSGKTNYKFRIDYDKGWKPAIHIGTGISNVLKNYDLLTLNLIYNYSFSNSYKGSYELYSDSDSSYISAGEFFNKGHFFGIVLNYTLTKTEKQVKIYDIIIKTDKVNKRMAEKVYRKEARKISNHSTFGTSLGGITIPINRANDPNKVLINASMASVMPYFSIEQNLQKNYFIEAGFGLQEYYNAIKAKEVPFWSGSNAFIAYHLTIGGGKRLIGKNNYNYLNLSSGLVLSTIDRPVGYAGRGGIGAVVGNDTIIMGRSENFISNNFFPLFYIGLSKDFRITRNFYFTMLYRYHQGFIKVYEQRVSYISKWTEGINNASNTMNGSYHTFQIGFKFRMGNIFNLKSSKKKQVNLTK